MFINIKKLAIILAIAGNLSNSAFAESVAIDPVISLFDTFQSKGLLGGEVIFAKARNEPVLIDLGGLAPTSITPERSIHFPFKLGMFSSGEKSTAVATEIVGGLTRVCEEQGGQLDVKVVDEGFNYFRGHRELALVIREAYTDLKTKKLIGEFTCVSEKGRNFFVTVMPWRTWEDSLFPPGYSWNIFVSLATGQQIASKEKELAQTFDEANQFRKSLQPGMQVAILASGVPPTLFPKTSLSEKAIKDNPLMVCAMVIDLKPPLVQLQVESGTLYVANSKVFPFKRKLNPLGALPSTDWDNWCVGT